MYIIEGTIGAGKSTFLKLLKQHIPHITVQFEPIDNWQSHENNQSLLANFYQDSNRWAYTFETFTLLSRIQEQKSLSKTAFLFVERSIYSGHSVFARNSYETGFMTTLEWNLYNQWFRFLTSDLTPPHGFIYLQVNPEVAYERMKKRNRSAESTLPLEYLYQIDRQHTKFLCQKTDLLPNLYDVPVLILDCNQEFELDSIHFSEQCARVQTFIETVQNNLVRSPYAQTQEQPL